MGKKRIEELANKYAVCAAKIAIGLIINRNRKEPRGCIINKLHVNFHGRKGDYFELETTQMSRNQIFAIL